ncbi:hypothetical protein INT45_002056 [Circinella minor]|uniref:Uncharacterized protein n=1 Tax=Circinella minor TaxID=1195481 RepID=A0A8H7SGS2_9FUNG|nr:hypothetical protein INT45_002056 [Circinella minor]
MNSPNVSDPGKEYFLKVVSRKWNFRDAFTLYEHSLKLPSNTLCQIMESDLNLITKSRKAFVEPSNAILSDLQFYVKQMESQQPSQQQQHIVTDNINDNYNNCSNLTKNIYHQSSVSFKDLMAVLTKNEKTKIATATATATKWKPVLVILSPHSYSKRPKKNYNSHLPNITPSISTNKPRINADDTKKLKDYFVTVINPHSGDDILECTRQEYEVNMEEQRVLHCFRKKSRTFDLLEFCLDGSLNELMDRIDEIRANVKDNREFREIVFW